MKTISKLYRIGFAGLILCLMGITLACNDDNDEPGLSPDEGEVVFGFLKIKTYEVSDMKDISSIKVTVEKDGKRTELPSLKMTGDADSLMSVPVRLEKGTYKITGYKIFSADAALLGEATLTKDNVLTVEAGQKGFFYFPMEVKVVYVNNTIKNVLVGMCLEIFGEDKDLWPWKEEDNLADWTNLEFETNDDGSIAYLTGIIFDKKFAPMKKLPEGLSSLASLEHISILDIDLEELSDDLSMTNVVSIVMLNTKFKKFPKDFFKMNLLGLSIINSELTEIPAEIAGLENLNLLEISGSHLTTLPAEIGKLTKLVSLSVTHSDLVSLPDAFGDLDKLSRLEVSYNPGLAALPLSIKDAASLRGIGADHCGFTAIPEALKQCAGIRGISLAANQLTVVSTADFAGNPEIEDIRLDSNKLVSFPALNMPNLIGLRLNDCGLATCPDLSGLPRLGQLGLEKNTFTTLPEKCFSGNPKLVILSLAGNALLTSLPADLGIALDEHGKPASLALVNVSRNPSLHWEVPANWCCMEVQKKEDFLAHNPNYTGGDLIIRRVNVEREGSPFVTRKPCTDCGSVK